MDDFKTQNFPRFYFGHVLIHHVTDFKMYHLCASCIEKTLTTYGLSNVRQFDKASITSLRTEVPEQSQEGETQVCPPFFACHCSLAVV
jgi:hypothetical protein